jgi:hypothetical protein
MRDSLPDHRFALVVVFFAVVLTERFDARVG